jgi:UDP-2-acetamido-2-deoxy-ribo-hexuluronate aminotransferase
MFIDFANLKIQYLKYKDEIDKNIQLVLNNNNYIMGEQVYRLEKELEKFTQSKYAITCSSGTDALTLALMALDIQPNDEIITTPFTFISTAETIALLKAKPVFVDIENDTFNLDANLINAKITSKTKAIIAVSLFGQPADLNEIQALASKNNVKLIIDGAQSFGSTYNGKTDSCLGDISTTSFFPAKPFGCYGDGGAIFTNNEEYARKIKMLRVHGQNKKYHHKYLGLGGRLDTLQASILLAKLPYFHQELLDRHRVAQKYSKALCKSIKTPVLKINRSSSWAQYTIRVKNRDLFQNSLTNYGIPTAVYYPVPLHLQECFQYLNYKKDYLKISEQASREVVSLPMNPFLTDEQIEYIIDKVLNYAL